jgi:hypothetical protein
MSGENEFEGCGRKLTRNFPEGTEKNHNTKNMSG